MLRHSWTRAYAEAFGLDRELEVMLAEGPSGAAIAPLRRTRGGWRLRLELIPFNERLEEPTDFVFAEGTDVAALADAIVATGLPLLLRKVRADSPILPALRHAYRGKGLTIARPHAACPWVALDESWLQPEEHVNAGRRSDLRRARRAAEKIGALRAEILSPKPAELPPLLEEVWRLEAMEWKTKAGTALANRPLLKDFYARFAEAASREGILRLCFLRIDGRAAATQYAVETGQRFWVLKIGFDAAFARCSPGILLMVETMRHAARAGLSAYEYLGEIEPWISTWTPHVHPCVSFRAFPWNARGIAALVASGAMRYRPLARLVERMGR